LPPLSRVAADHASRGPGLQRAPRHKEPRKSSNRGGKKIAGVVSASASAATSATTVAAASIIFPPRREKSGRDLPKASSAAIFSAQPASHFLISHVFQLNPLLLLLLRFFPEKKSLSKKRNPKETFSLHQNLILPSPSPIKPTHCQKATETLRKRLSPSSSSPKCFCRFAERPFCVGPLRWKKREKGGEKKKGRRDEPSIFFTGERGERKGEGGEKVSWCAAVIYLAKLVRRRPCISLSAAASAAARILPEEEK
jgi:hypothetical protein